MRAAVASPICWLKPSSRHGHAAARVLADPDHERAGGALGAPPQRRARGRRRRLVVGGHVRRRPAASPCCVVGPTAPSTTCCRPSTARARRCTSTAAAPGGCAVACCGSRTGRRSACIGSMSAALRSRSHRSPRCPAGFGTPTATCIPTAPRSSASRRSTTPTAVRRPTPSCACVPTSRAPPRSVVDGPDFVSDPRWRPDGGAFCWLEWDHPDMPWDATRLVVDDHGARTVVAGADRRESIGQPAVDARWLALVLRRSNGVLEPLPVDSRSGARGRRRPRQGHRLPPVGLRAVHLRLSRRRSCRVLVQRRRPGAPGGAGAGLRSGEGRRPTRHVDRRTARDAATALCASPPVRRRSPTSSRSTSPPAPSRCSYPRVTWVSTTGGSRSLSPSPSRRPEARRPTGCSTAPPTRTRPHPTESAHRCS